MVRMSRKAGVESATQAAHSGLPAATNIGAIERLLPKRTWLICEVIRVQAHVGVGAFVGYAFSGDETDGALARIAGTTDGPLLTCLPEMTKQWAGPRPKVLQFAEEDVDVASNLFGTLLVRALDAKEERLEREASDVRAAEEARVAAEAKAAEELEARRKKLADAQAARAAEDAAENEPA
jgi:hypothetical protein